jgi:hypothetical protein
VGGIARPWRIWVALAIAVAIFVQTWRDDYSPSVQHFVNDLKWRGLVGLVVYAVAVGVITAIARRRERD